jgi:hypothetical protein
MVRTLRYRAGQSEFNFAGSSFRVVVSGSVIRVHSYRLRVGSYMGVSNKGVGASRPPTRWIPVATADGPFIT